jgi:predicted nucleic acid-binding protein
MIRFILLDSGPLGLVTNPRGSEKALLCNERLRAMLKSGNTVIVPEITDYEVRRELLRANKRNGIGNLDLLKSTVTYLPITTRTMLRAAEYWADVRKKGKQTADDRSLDGDVILAAQASLLEGEGKDVIVATENVGHLSLFVNAESWETIR